MIDRTYAIRRTLKDALLSACAVGVLLIALVAVDGRVRDEISTNMAGARVSTEHAADQGRTQLAFWAHVIKNESEQHAPLLVMVVVGTMLALFMFRT